MSATAIFITGMMTGSVATICILATVAALIGKGMDASDKAKGSID